METTIYIESSVVSYYTSRSNRDIVIAARQRVTQEWWENIRPGFDNYVSVLVMNEITRGDTVEAQKRLAVIKEIPVLEINEEALVLTEALVKARAIPEKFKEDALHISIAAANGIDLLVTWNFAHINNAMTRYKIMSTLESLGYQCPVLCSPEEFEEDER